MDKKKNMEANTLESMLSKAVQVITTEGRVFFGNLRGVDQTLNVILSESKERIYSMEEGTQDSHLGLYMIRGEVVAIIGETDETVENQLDQESIQAAPLPPMTTN